MNSNVRKVIMLITGLLFCGYTSAQPDSTDFALSAVASPENNESFEFALEFDYNVVSDFSNMTIELLFSDPETVEWSTYIESFQIADLDESTYYTGGSILIHPGAGMTGYNYCLVIRLTDINGHQLVINKKIAL